MNPNINMHNMQQQMNAPGVTGHSPMMQPGMSPVMMQQTSPQQPTAHPMSSTAQITSGVQVPSTQSQTATPSPQVVPVQGAPPQQQQQQPQAAQQAEKIDDISKIKSIMGPLRESLFMAQRNAAFALQHNNLADNLKRDIPPHSGRFDKDIENFYAYCDEMEVHIKTAIMCQQQQQLAQFYLPGVVTAGRSENYIQDNPNGSMSYPVYLNTVRGQLQSAKDIHDTLISAAQNISQAD